MAKKSKAPQGPFPMAEGQEDTSGLQTSGSVGMPGDPTQEKLDAQLKSVQAELKWRNAAMQQMTQQDASTYYQNNVKRLEDEVAGLKEQGAVEEVEETEEATEEHTEE